MVQGLGERLKLQNFNHQDKIEFTPIPTDLLASLRAKLEKALALPSQTQLTTVKPQEPSSRSTDFFPDFTSPSSATSAAE